MDRQRKILAIILGIAGLCFVLLCALALLTVGLDSLTLFLAEPWGFATLYDLWLGALCMGVVIYLCERDWKRTLLWAVPIFLLGNIVSVAWLILRGMKLHFAAKSR